MSWFARRGNGAGPKFISCHFFWTNEDFRLTLRAMIVGAFKEDWPVGLRDANSIDMIVQPLPSEVDLCKLVLVIVDSGSETDDAVRYQLLIQKLAAYVAFVNGEMFKKEYPTLAADDVLVRVLTVVEPTAQMLQVEAVRSRDETVRLRVAFENYHAFLRRVKGGGPMPEPGNN